MVQNVKSRCKNAVKNFPPPCDTFHAGPLLLLMRGGGAGKTTD